ncbi:MAG: phage replication initiation protein, NGO0469 family [Flavobacterium sp.]
MAIIAENKSNGGNYTPIDAGTYVARCYSMIYMGTISDEFQGQKKDLKKVRITWELPTELKVFKDDEYEKPQVVGKEFTLSMNEKGTLRKFLQSWRGKAFTEQEANSFDITKLLGKPCMLSIIHKESKSGKTYAEISSVSTLPKGMVCPNQVNQNFEFSILSYEEDVFNQLPDFIKDKIKTSKEYKQLQSIKPAPVTPMVQAEDEDDSLPF